MTNWLESLGGEQSSQTLLEFHQFKGNARRNWTLPPKYFSSGLIQWKNNCHVINTLGLIFKYNSLENPAAENLCTYPHPFWNLLTSFSPQIGVHALLQLVKNSSPYATHDISQWIKSPERWGWQGRGQLDVKLFQG